jgi:hypothetical protein
MLGSLPSAGCSRTVRTLWLRLLCSFMLVRAVTRLRAASCRSHKDDQAAACQTMLDVWDASSIMHTRRGMWLRTLSAERMSSAVPTPRHVRPGMRTAPAV